MGVDNFSVTSLSDIINIYILSSCWSTIYEKTGLDPPLLPICCCLHLVASSTILWVTNISITDIPTNRHLRKAFKLILARWCPQPIKLKLRVYQPIRERTQSTSLKTLPLRKVISYNNTTISLIDIIVTVFEYINSFETLLNVLWLIWMMDVWAQSKKAKK